MSKRAAIITRPAAALLTTCLLLLLFCGVAAAQAQPDKEGFVPDNRPAMSGGGQKDESIPAAPLVATAYGFIWVAVLVFVGSVARRASRLEAEVAGLQAKLDKIEGR